MKRSRINPVSAKRKREQKEYSEWRKGALLRRPNCELRWASRCRGRATDVHHVVKRSQGAKLVPESEDDWMPACRPCHDKVDQEPQEAKDRGFVRRPWMHEHKWSLTFRGMVCQCGMVRSPTKQELMPFVAGGDRKAETVDDIIAEGEIAETIADHFGYRYGISPNRRRSARIGLWDGEELVAVAKALDRKAPYTWAKLYDIGGFKLGSRLWFNIRREAANERVAPILMLRLADDSVGALELIDDVMPPGAKALLGGRSDRDISTDTEFMFHVSLTRFRWARLLGDPQPAGRVLLER